MRPKKQELLQPQTPFLRTMHSTPTEQRNTSTIKTLLTQVIECWGGYPLSFPKDSRLRQMVRMKIMPWVTIARRYVTYSKTTPPRRESTEILTDSSNNTRRNTLERTPRKSNHRTAQKSHQVACNDDQTHIHSSHLVTIK